MTSSRQHGFALLFVILTIGTMSLLMASITAQYLVQNAHFRRVFLEKQARRAAMFALKVAVARLQESAGPDNAISAKKSNVYGKIPPEEDDVGVWHVAKNGPQCAVKFMRWLTSDYDSGNPRGTKKISRIRSCAAANQSQWSFTIQDESQKITLSLWDETRDNYMQHLCPQCSGYEEITTILMQRKRDPGECKNMDFLEQISFLDENLGKKIVGNAGTYTLHSYGVLSKLNGLKTDLSTWLSATNFRPNDYIFTGKTSLPAPPPTWKFLQSFFHLGDQVGKNGIGASPTYPLYRPQYLADYSQRSLHSTGDDLGIPTSHGIYPIITQFNFSLSGATIGGKLAIKIRPKFTLWNPHNITLQHTDYQLDALIFPQNLDSKICLTIRGKPRTPNVPDRIDILPLCSDEIEWHLRRMFGIKFSDSFAPGEVKIFSLSTNDELGATRVTTAVSGDYNNCFTIKTDIETSGFTEFIISCTDQNKVVNLNWQEFYMRLTHQSSRAILQEIAQLSPACGQSLAFIFKPEEAEKTLLTLSSSMKVGLLDDAQTGTGIRWLSFANPRAPYVNRALFQDPTSILLGPAYIPGNWSWNAKFTGTNAALDLRQLNYLHGLILFDVPSGNRAIPNVAFLRHVNWTPFGYLPCTCLGNSNSNPYIPTSYTIFRNPSSGIWSSHNLVESLFDYSYLLNEALFDNFFCSTANAAKKLANRRFKLLDGEVAPETMLVRGSFNVHSSSEEAWEAYLCSRKNGNGEIIFPRIYNPNAGKCASFSKYEVRNLAKHIVTLVKQRSLFPTLSAFINRELVENGTQCGLLQRAIFNANINHKTCKHYISFGKNKNWFNDAAASGYLEEGLPEVLNQADVLQGIAHFISTRGDTFKIIARGSHANCEKCCEVIVQRMPIFANSGENAATDTTLSAANKKLGRRFSAILFRWL
ncbi:MAG: hypothetical protein LBD33_03860 [Puniceicoccales bacterium]|nr:hypothetical protein [Puniceicoccales bacterium]